MTEQRREFAAEGPSVARALEAMLRELLAALRSVPDRDEAADRSVKVRAEGDSLPGVVTHLIEQIGTIGADFDEYPIQITIEGFREQGGEVRVWGVAGLAQDAGDPPTLKILTPPEITPVQGGWRISVSVAISGDDL
ncbi:MAG: hypothetical protein M3Y37_02335 [Chloroflexota bacterium]|nr:hypothetical protein [Chloroflexota bacterium]